jgi:hypothetical protein
VSSGFWNIFSELFFNFPSPAAYGNKPFFELLKPAVAIFPEKAANCI